jgi:hypothetical protein
MADQISQLEKSSHLLLVTQVLLELAEKSWSLRKFVQLSA